VELLGWTQIVLTIAVWRLTRGPLFLVRARVANESVSAVFFVGRILLVAVGSLHHYGRQFGTVTRLFGLLAMLFKVVWLMTKVNSDLRLVFFMVPDCVELISMLPHQEVPIGLTSAQTNYLAPF
jgi:hypothetical protein